MREGRCERQPPEEISGRWRLLVQHESGSLDTAVATIRRRNLAISSGILLLLTFAVVMLTATSRRAEKLAQQQMEFVAGVSHELRTPVAVVRSAAENLSSGVVTGDRVKRYGQMSKPNRGASATWSSACCSTQASSRASTPPRAYHSHRPGIIESAVDSALPLVGPGEVTVIERSRRICNRHRRCDRASSAVQNLVANAVKYGGRDRWVGIRAQNVRERRRRGAHQVSDHGPGIPAADLPHISSRSIAEPTPWNGRFMVTGSASRWSAASSLPTAARSRVDEAGSRHVVHDHVARRGAGYEREPDYNRNARRCAFIRN